MDSLRNYRDDNLFLLNPMPLINALEAEKNLLKNVGDDLEENEKFDSNDTSPRSIPDEHNLSISYEDHYLENYM